MKKSAGGDEMQGDEGVDGVLAVAGEDYIQSLNHDRAHNWTDARVSARSILKRCKLVLENLANAKVEGDVDRGWCG